MSTQLPQLPLESRVASRLVAATVSAAVALAGGPLRAFWFSLPDTTVVKIPALDRFVTAVFSALENPPPSDRLATAGFCAFTRTQSIAATIPAVVPEPLQSSTRTPRSETPLATP